MSHYLQKLFSLLSLDIQMWFETCISTAMLCDVLTAQ